MIRGMKVLMMFLGMVCVTRVWAIEAQDKTSGKGKAVEIVAVRDTNTAFMQGKYGILCDYLYGYPCLPITNKGMIEWNNYVNSFNTTTFANNCAAEGVGYVILVLLGFVWVAAHYGLRSDA